MSRLVLALALFVLFAGSGCVVGYEPGAGLPCETDDDCISGYACSAGNTCETVVSGDPSGCFDEDGDGYGVGEPADLVNCPACQTGEPSGCESDCDDSNDAVHPGAAEQCDGVDNNCVDGTDEQVACENSGDCPNDPDARASCDDGTCVYFPIFQEPGVDECFEPLECTNGAREEAPAACMP